MDSQVAGAGGVFNLATGQCTYGQNLFGKMYPASTTKILTCLVAIEQADLDTQVTVSAHAADQTSDSSVANLAEGDAMTLKDLLYGLMLRSGNDAAIAIAETIGGSEEGFAKLMNEKAAALGATHSHFVTPHGLHEDDHYTTVYDMYLIFQAAVQNETFYRSSVRRPMMSLIPGQTAGKVTDLGFDQSLSKWQGERTGRVYRSWR